MSIVVTVRIPNADIDKVREVSQSNPDLGLQLKELLEKHGNLSHQRIYRDTEILDIDEWETEEGFNAFVVEAAPIIQKLVELRGTGVPQDTVWYRY